jgi:hypothetical protein
LSNQSFWPKETEVVSEKSKSSFLFWSCFLHFFLFLLGTLLLLGATRRSFQKNTQKVRQRKTCFVFYFVVLVCRSQCFDDSDLMTLMTRDALKYKIEDEPTHKKSMLVSLGKKIVNAPLSLGKVVLKFDRLLYFATEQA